MTCLWLIIGRNIVTDFRDWVGSFGVQLTMVVRLDLKILLRTVPDCADGRWGPIRTSLSGLGGKRGAPPVRELPPIPPDQIQKTNMKLN